MGPNHFEKVKSSETYIIAMRCDAMMIMACGWQIEQTLSILSFVSFATFVMMSRLM